MDCYQLLTIAEEVAKEAGQILLSSKPFVTQSFGKDIKLSVDKEAHDFIIDALTRKSSLPILSEEDDVHVFSKDTMWVVDPLDGSMNFSRNIPISAVSIGLMDKNEPVLGVVYDFNRNELFSGCIEKGATLNGKSIKVSDKKEKGESVIMTGFPSYTDYSLESLQKYISLVQEYKKVRIIGSAALSLAYVASGRADAYFEKDIKIWDVCAGVALVKSANGTYTIDEVGREGKTTVCAYN